MKSISIGDLVLKQDPLMGGIPQPWNLYYHPPQKGYVTWVLIKDFGKHSHQHLTLENLMASKGSSGSTKLETAYLIAESVDNL